MLFKGNTATLNLGLCDVKLSQVGSSEIQMFKLKQKEFQVPNETKTCKEEEMLHVDPRRPTNFLPSPGITVL